ncbi:hemerythrin domain-containing protein [Salinisphaera aquimarina]|uniref:Hemerythrin domain-containing protein n=1 Tax=Salinisphaera aquimarina TaxID=2094031 RepID=A0ABV7EPM5_9GAMM
MPMREFADELLLPNRRELPAEVAFLREHYPAPQWREHENFGELAAFWLQVHDSLRRHGQALQQATEAFREGRWDVARFQQYFAPRLDHYLQHLEGHHHIEDAHYFPRFRGLDRRMVRGFDLLENDHEIIHDTLLASAASARRLIEGMVRGGDAPRYAADAYTEEADRLLSLLEQHLSDEEDLVIPAMLEYSERPLR